MSPANELPNTGRSRSPIAVVLQQHVEDAAILHSIRTTLAAAPHVKLKHILSFDDRVAAHLDGLSVAGEHAWQMLDAALASPSAGAVFAATVMAIETKSAERLNRLYALAEAVPEAQRGLVSAFGWVGPDQLQGIVSGQLASPNPFLKLLGITACAMHRVDPGNSRKAALEPPALEFRNRNLRLAGELGSLGSLRTCLNILAKEDGDSRFWAAWSAVLLGNRGAGLEVLRSIGAAPGRFQSRAFRLALQTMDLHAAHEWLRSMARSPDNLRLVIQGSGIVGDPHYVAWLIEHMGETKTARLAGEAFSLIAGLDLAYLGLDRKPPEHTGAGPNDDPEDPHVTMDEDDGLPWPDPDRLIKWWQENRGRFAAGTRYFLGRPITRDSCIRVLKEGFQRQRILAAHYLCLLEPGTTLFEWRAPAFRQQRLLAAMV